MSARHRRGERGLSQSVQYALIFPALMLCTLGIIQAGMWVYGRHVASEAAHAAVDVARSAHADAGSARTAALRIAAVGGLSQTSVLVERGPAEVRVAVSAQVPVILDLGLGRVTESAAAPVERVTTP